ncbi:hypothetical protein ACHYSV_004536, partial [Vibrio vulnificus]
VMLNYVKSVVYVFSVPSAFQFCVCRQVGFFERCFSDSYSLALEIQIIASINFWVSARLGRWLNQKSISRFSNFKPDLPKSKV